MIVLAERLRIDGMLGRKHQEFQSSCGTFTKTWQYHIQIDLHPMAAACAYEQPSIQKAWQAFCAHLPTMVLIWIGSIAPAVMGGVLGGILRGILGGVAGFSDGSDTANSIVSGLVELVQIPFAILSSLVYVLFSAVPAQYYDSGEVISPETAVATLLKRPWRYVLAGIFFLLLTLLGFLFCIIPGIVISFVMPIYVNRIFLTDQPIPDAFASSFQAVYRSPNGLSFVGIQLLVSIVVVIVTVCTCGLAGLVAIPMGNFYIQNIAYSKGLVR